jgi:hypothetical protein
MVGCAKFDPLGLQSSEKCYFDRKLVSRGSCISRLKVQGRYSERGDITVF